MNTRLFKWLLTATVICCFIFVSTTVSAKKPVKPPPYYPVGSIQLGSGDDIWPGPGDDNFGDEDVFGGDGDDIISGGPGDDNLYGESGEDVLDGEDGNDPSICH